MHISLIILGIILVAIALRQCLPIRTPIWTIMIIGAFLCLISQQITPHQALNAIDLNVILYLFGVFALSSALEQSGLLEHTVDRWFNHCPNFNVQLLLIVFGLGLSSALLMNDTIAIIGTPVILQLCRGRAKLTPWLLMLLAYSVTIGSVMSPIGNPQNLLIANHLQQPHVFWLFIKHLTLPTLINLSLLTLLFRYRLRHLPQQLKPITPAALPHPAMATWAKLALCLFCIMVVLKLWINIPFGAIALIAAAPVLLFATPRKPVWRHIDWGTLGFFIGLFIVMQSVWQDGSIQALIHDYHIHITEPSNILIISTLLSQLISNVPMVALYLPLLHHTQPTQAMALAAGSTMAGNLLLFGAASNIIISDNAEKRGQTGIPFWRFFFYGLPITAVGISVYWLYLYITTL